MFLVRFRKILIWGLVESFLLLLLFGGYVYFTGTSALLQKADAPW